MEITGIELSSNPQIVSAVTFSNYFGILETKVLRLARDKDELDYTFIMRNEKLVTKPKKIGLSPLQQGTKCIVLNAKYQTWVKQNELDDSGLWEHATKKG